MSESLIFKLRLAKVPLWNVRIEFQRTLNILKAADFRAQIENYGQGNYREPIHAYHILWGGPPQGLLTLLLQRTIIGIEAYLPSALFIAAIHYGKVNDQVIRAKNDPFDLKTRRAGTADTFYNGLPGLLHEDYMLQRFNGAIWKQIREFYESVRNPLFHGYELETVGWNHTETLDAVLRAHEMFTELYTWLDWWCPQGFIIGSGASGRVPISEMPTLKEDHPIKRKGHD